MNLMNNEKHYVTLSNYYLNKYGKKVFKVSLNAGFSCPNKDGLLSTEGCSYCSSLGSGEFAGNVKEPLDKQFFSVLEEMKKKWNDAYYIPYFQANTNTYAPLEKLKTTYESVINLSPLIKEISISTRPDCLPVDIVNYLGELNKRIPVQIELGLQTIHEKTSNLINRCHNLECFLESVKLLREKNIEVVVHIINGLPFETKEMMIETVDFLSKLDIQGIKIHLLHIMKNTRMGNEFLKNPFKTLTLEEYVDIVVNQIRHLRSDIVIHRLTGDAKKELLIEPLWSLKKFVVINEIDKKMRKINAYQGDLFTHLANPQTKENA